MGPVNCTSNWAWWDPEDHVCNACLTPGQSIGLAFSAQAGVISFVSVIALFAIVVVKYYQASPAQRSRMFGYLDVFMTNLFISELLMSLGGALDAKWANETQVYCGGYCDAQGSLQFLGETSVSIWTLAITLYTWWSVTNARGLVFQPLICYGIVAAVWVYVFAFNFGSYASRKQASEEDRYFTPGPFWCWVSPKYKGHRYGEYVWLWLAGAGNILVYIPLYLLLRGNLVLGESLFSMRLCRTPHFSQEEASKPGDSSSVTSTTDDDEGDARKDAFKLLWYPIVYTVLVLPLSIVRWMSFGDGALKNPHMPNMAPLATAQLVFHALYRLSGVVNVALVLGTRPNVWLLGRKNREPGDEEEDRNHHLHDSRSMNDGTSLRHRANTAQTEEERGAGWGGPPVNLDRSEDFSGH